MITINRIGEEKTNNFGSKIVIIDYKNTGDVTIYFPEYNWTCYHRTYANFKQGKIKCPYEPRIYGKGFIGEGKYKSTINGKHTKAYTLWQDMLGRCYNEYNLKRRPTYKDCEVCDEWLNFQNFAEWFDNNYYTIDNEAVCLDKDILIKGNKTYSPEACVFVPITINSLFTKINKLENSYIKEVTEKYKDFIPNKLYEAMMNYEVEITD